MAPIPMEDALVIKSRFEPDVLKMPGVTGVDVGATADGAPLIRVYVRSLDRGPALPASVEGVPVQLLERTFDAQ